MNRRLIPHRSICHLTQSQDRMATQNCTNRNRINVTTLECPIDRALRRLTLIIRVTHSKITLFSFRKRATCTPCPFCLASCPPGPRKPAAVTIPAHFRTLFPSLLLLLQLSFRCILRHPRVFSEARKVRPLLRPEKFSSSASICESSPASTPRINFTRYICSYSLKD